MSMTVFYRLEHHHVKNGYASDLHIGTFSSFDLAENAIDQLINKPGFSLYSRSNFIITEVILNNIVWKNGFTKSEKGDIEIK